MKKVLIASVFACIMLILPLNTVVGVSDVEDDCNCKPVSNLHLVILERLSNRLDRLLNRVELYTGIISILYKYNPEVTEEFKELSNEIITLRESNNELKSVFEFGLHQMICDALASVIYPLMGFYLYLYNITEEYPQLIPILYPTLFALLVAIMPIYNLYFYILMCE